MMANNQTGPLGNAEASEHRPNAARAYAALADHPKMATTKWIIHGVASIIVARFAYASLWGWCSALIELFIMIAISLFLFVNVLMVRIRTVARDAKSVKAAPQAVGHAPRSYLYVLGSGGHTTEMIDLIKLTWRPDENAHRRYIITPDDTTSKLRKRDLERLISMSVDGRAAGTHDTFLVNRARNVHESLLSSIQSTIRCFGQVVDALTRIPAKRALDASANAYKYPHVIITNGPGTGLIVAVVALVLKVLYLAPTDRMTVLYFESWARTHNLGVTGKLFHWLSPLVSLFVVQNDSLAQKFGKPNIGNINSMVAKLPRPTTTSGTNQTPKAPTFEAATHKDVSHEAVPPNNVSHGQLSHNDVAPNEIPHNDLSHIYVSHKGVPRDDV